jgi:3-hydroxyacyl-CoA dehydrogenase/enoyl-CoA hydratase/3-hydroxybutyryl-CoA epimerase
MSPARKAQRIGLVDALAPREALAAAAEKVVARLPNLSLPRRRPVVNRLCSQGPLRRWILGKARASVLARTHGQFPAPLRILESVDAAFSPGEAGGYAVEARLLGELLVSGPSRNLVRLFQLAEKAREVAEEEAPIRRVFVAGAGTMGAGIAALFASKGMRTRLFDSYPESLLKGMKFIHSLFARKVKRRGGGAAQLQAILDQLEPTPELTGLRSQDLFLEAVIEKLDVKQELLAKVEEQLPAHACIATNTSSLDLNAMATVLQRPERLVGIHFFNPVHRMRLVEIVRGSATSEAAVESARALVRRLGKVPVVVGNAPGFLVNRLLAPYLLQAERIVAEGASVEFIDRLMKQAGMPMGPLELLDEVGLDVAAHVARTMQNAFPERFQPGELVQSLCEQGDLGKKTGRGFYHHGKKVFVNHSLQKWRKSSFAMDPEVLKDRMILPVVLEGLRCLEAGIVRSDDEVDLAMLLGTGFLLPHGGPMQAAKQRGWANVLEAVEQLSAGDAAGCFQVPELLKQRVGQPEEVPA